MEPIAILLSSSLVFALGCSRPLEIPVAEDAAGGVDAARAPRCDGGAPLADEMVGTFYVIAPGCGPHGGDPNAEWTRLVLLSIDACGGANTGVPDSPDTTDGTVRRDGEAHVYEADRGFGGRGSRLAFSVRVLEETRAGAQILELRSASSAEPWEAWAIRSRGWAPQQGTPPSIFSCAVRETWKLSSANGAGAPLAEGGGEIAAASDGPYLRIGNPTTRTFSLTDRRLAMYDGRSTDERAGGYYGVVESWTGAGGRASSRTTGVCLELDDSVQLLWDGTTLVTEADWLVLDSDDRDGDGDRNERLVRRTRTEWRADACP